MVSPAVGRFDLKKIHVLNRLRVAQDVVVAAADIATEKVPEFASALLDVQNNLRSSENVPGIAKCNRDTIADQHRSVVVESNKLAHGFLGVDGTVERFDRRQALFCAL